MMSLLKSSIKKRWLYSCLLVFYIACNETPAYNTLVLTREDSALIREKNIKARKTILTAKHFIEQGDMILRTGNDFTSESLRQFSEKDKTYSHCGIASIENDTVFVYHSLGGEWNPDQKLRRDPLELFCSPLENRGFGIFKFDFTKDQLSTLDSVIHSWHRKGVMFDMDFSLKSDDRLYCAEFVAKAINNATDGAFGITTTRIKDFEFYAVDNLQLNPHCTEKKHYRFE